MTETNGQGPRVALYERVSTQEQATSGYSLDGQLHELKARMEAEGRRVVAEVADPGEKRWMSTRPGLEKIRSLAAAGEIDEVWAWSWDRFGESPVPEVLAVELDEHGVRLRSLDDGGEGLGGEIMRAVGGVLSRADQRSRVRKSKMGMRSKARRGQVLGAGPRPRYGFGYVRNGKGRPVGYAVCEKEMAVVRRIFGMLDEGRSIHAVQVALEQDGVEAPRGGRRWSRDTIKNMVREDTYLPHSSGEIAALVTEGSMSEEVYSGLDPDQPYGIAYYGRTRSSYASTRSKRRKVEPAPRHEWTAIPVALAGSGLDRGLVERARRTIEDNRVSSKVGDRFWELSRGLLFCAHCGRTMKSYARRFPKKNRNHYYYRCDQRHKARGMLPAECPNRKSHRAEVLEYYASNTFELYANAGMLLELFDQALREEQRLTDPHDGLERCAALRARLAELAQERKGYLRQDAKGVLRDGELDDLLGEIDAQREQVTAELHATEDATAGAERMREARACFLSAEWYEDPDAIQPHEWPTLGASPEQLRRAYKRFGARFEVDADGVLTLHLNLALDGGPLLTENSYCSTGATIP